MASGKIIRVEQEALTSPNHSTYVTTYNPKKRTEYEGKCDLHPPSSMCLTHIG